MLKPDAAKIKAFKSPKSLSNWLRGNPATPRPNLGSRSIRRHLGFLVEFLRAKDDRFFGLLTLAQMISLGIAAVGLVEVIRRFVVDTELPDPTSMIA